MNVPDVPIELKTELNKFAADLANKNIDEFYRTITLDSGVKVILRIFPRAGESKTENTIPRDLTVTARDWTHRPDGSLIC